MVADGLNTIHFNPIYALFSSSLCLHLALFCEFFHRKISFAIAVQNFIIVVVAVAINVRVR